jgi:CxxH/CxxC protein (TIGR04129 family)
MGVWYSCNEHIDIVIEDMIDEFTNAPVLEVVGGTHACHLCGKRAIYQLQCALEREENKQ